MTQQTFAALGVSEPLLRALEGESHSTPTPIQTDAIPLVIAGRDLLGIAQTGTGKTAAFVLPILDRLAAAGPAPRKQPRALVLAPTRELAAQIGERARAYGRNLQVRQAVVFGGVGLEPQARALARGVDLLVATPGRLLDLMGRNAVMLDRVEVLVLDEADRMLDMGFLPDVRRIVAAVPKRRQTLLFSATMPDEVARLAAGILDNPARVEVTPEVVTVERIEQRVYHVPAREKRALLAGLLADPALSRVIVFTRTKHGANRVAEQLERAGFAAAAIHGNKSQGAREKALAGFRDGRARVLVATDIAARGIDVAGVTHVVNFDIPNVPESYVHRIGRTARAGAAGIALSFCDPAERSFLKDIERLTGRRLEVANDMPVVDATPERTSREERAPRGDRKPRAPHGGKRPPRAAAPPQPARQHKDAGWSPLRRPAADGPAAWALRLEADERTRGDAGREGGTESRRERGERRGRRRRRAA